MIKNRYVFHKLVQKYNMALESVCKQDFLINEQIELYNI